MKKTFGIIGAGNIAQTVARHLLQAGHAVILSNSKGPETLQTIIEEIAGDIKAGTAQEAAAAEVVVLALPWSAIQTLPGLTNWKDRLVIDATNHYITFAPEFKTADLGNLASSEVIAGLIPEAKVVKSFNTLYFKVLGAPPQQDNGKRVIFYSGDDANANKTVGELIESFGFAAIDLGTLAMGSKLQQAGGALAGKNLLLL
jgi:predicted dinucleotide-binding enzyme